MYTYTSFIAISDAAPTTAFDAISCSFYDIDFVPLLTNNIFSDASFIAMSDAASTSALDAFSATVHFVQRPINWRKL